MPISQQILLKSRPKGTPTQDNFEFQDVEVPAPAAGEVQVQNIYMSVDPYMRGRMRMQKPGDLLEGGAVGKILASNNSHFSVGDYVSHGKGWRQYFNSDGSDLEKIDASIAPLSAYLGVMGMPGLTAYGGLLVTGELKDGETVFVSAASGAVGSVVGQIAKTKGC
ncbi:MAG: NADPH-dependent curcumin reductase CurA, partial [Paraglaciecola psychrophila]